jgi:pyruvate dehydrogenase E2 component (dihydrolipoamide acetyltransferase)
MLIGQPGEAIETDNVTIKPQVVGKEAARVVVPAAGQTTDQLTLLKWRVKEGDTIKRGDVLGDLETDKAVMELESIHEGQVLKVLASEGETVTVGSTIMFIGQPGDVIAEEAPAQKPATKEPEQEMAPVPAPSEKVPAQARTHAGYGPCGFRPSRTHPASAAVVTRTGLLLATPAARALAKQQGVDLRSVIGHGPEGCIVLDDVRQAGTGMSTADAALLGTSQPMSRMRRAIADRLQQSMQQSPHFYVAMDVDMTNALAARERFNASRSGQKVTINDMIVKAAADTLARFPKVNCRMENGTLHYLKDVHVGVAVSLEDGLVVPVLANADKLPLAEVSQRTRSLVAEARSGKTGGGSQGTFTVSNLGMYGVKFFTAIINPPESAILAVGGIEDKLVLTPRGISAIPNMTLTLSSDHRVIDGGLAAQFLAALRDRLQLADWV